MHREEIRSIVVTLYGNGHVRKCHTAVFFLRKMYSNAPLFNGSWRSRNNRDVHRYLAQDSVTRAHLASTLMVMMMMSFAPHSLYGIRGICTHEIAQKLRSLTSRTRAMHTDSSELF